MTPLLSILVAGTPSRVESFALPLIRRLEAQAVGLPVEILYLLDNKMRSVGGKRQALLDIARGDYVAFCDDDDAVEHDYIREILGAINLSRPDVVTFDQLADIGGYIGIVHCRLGQAEECFAPSPHVTPRDAWHFHAWRRSLAQCCKFPDLMDGEDYAWAKQARTLAKSEVHLDKVLHRYTFRPALTEATGKNLPQH